MAVADSPIHEIGTEDSSFTLATLARDCHPLQFLRELTQNAAEAGASTVLWDVDWDRYFANGGRWKKLACIDDGHGMNAAELERFVGNLAASGKRQGLGKNFGMGLKDPRTEAPGCGSRLPPLCPRS